MDMPDPPGSSSMSPASPDPTGSVTLEMRHSIGWTGWPPPAATTDRSAPRADRLRRFALPVLLGIRRQRLPGRIAATAGGGPPGGVGPGRPSPVLPHHIDYGRVIPWKLDLLDRAFDRFTPDDSYLEFRRTEAAWLDDFALFMALKDQYGGRPWVDWPAPFRAGTQINWSGRSTPIARRSSVTPSANGFSTGSGRRSGGAPTSRGWR